MDESGLRPIWRLFIYAIMARALYLLLGSVIPYLEQSNLAQLWLDFVAETIFLIAAFVPAVLLSRMEHRCFGAYGLPARQALGKSFWAGVIWGLAALSILIFTMLAAKAFSFGRLNLHGLRILKFAAFWAVFFLIVGLAEEFLLRGYAQFTLTQAVRFWPAAILLSVGFGAIHLRNPGENLRGILAAFAIGLFFCLTLRRTGTLWFAVGFHSAWDWGESYLYSAPDSGQMVPGHLLKSSFHGPAWLTGGTAGPEGSLLLFLLIALLWLAFDRVYPVVPTPNLKSEI